MRTDNALVLMTVAIAILAGCAGPGKRDRAPKRPPDVMSVPDAVPRAEPRSKSGNPPFYEVYGKRYYVMKSGKGHTERGVASWYGEKFHGRRTSSGEPYDMYAMTAAHKTLPLPSYARVTNLANGRSVVVRINDRGPFVNNRIVDLSYTAARKLNIVAKGTAMVELQVLGPGVSVTGKSRDTRQTPVPTRAASAPLPTPTRAGRQDNAMFVQVGAFGQSANAEALASRLRGDGITDVVVKRDEVGGETLYRVRIGPVDGVEHYDWMVARMAELGIHESYLAVE